MLIYSTTKHIQKKVSAIIALVLFENANITIPMMEASPAAALNMNNKFLFKNLMSDYFVLVVL